MDLCGESGRMIDGLLCELDELEREYMFAWSRAEAHRRGAAEGKFLEAAFLDGAVCRMAEIEARMRAIAYMLEEFEV